MFKRQKFNKIINNKSAVDSSKQQRRCSTLQQQQLNNQQQRNSIYYEINVFKDDLTTTQPTQKQQQRYYICKETLMEHRHKLRPLQLFVPAISNPNILRLNKNALNAVLGHSSIANRKVG